MIELVNCVVIGRPEDKEPYMIHGVEGIKSLKLKEFTLIPTEQFEAVKAEVERLRAERDALMDNQIRENIAIHEELQAEVERLREALIWLHNQLPINSVLKPHITRWLREGE